MARFTEEQRCYAQAMKMIIELHHDLKALNEKCLQIENPNDGWYSDRLIEKIAEVLHWVIPSFSPCIYVRPHRHFRYGGNDEKITLTTGGLITFVEIMEALKTDLSKGPTPTNQPFVIKEVISKQHRRPHQFSDEKMQTANRQSTNDRNELELAILHELPDVAGDDYSKFYDRLHTALTVSSNHFEAFTIGTNSNSVLEDAFFPADEDRVSCPGFVQDETSFIEVIHFALVKYQYLFESFERVKICKQCGKLFWEKRLGTKEFCGGTCRKRYNDSLQSPDIRLCRERQNAWITRMGVEIVSMPSVYRLQKDDCDGCTRQCKGGACARLAEKNPKGFSVLKKVKRIPS